MAKTDSLFEHVLGSFQQHVVGKLRRSWCLQEKEERKFRYQTIVQLILELDRIKKVSAFSTALAEGAIGSIIEGDWEDAEGYADIFEFKDEDEDLREKFVPLWKDFVLILRSACQTAGSERVKN